MDTQTNLPYHIHIGGYVKITEWVGLIEDIAIGQAHIILLISSPKQVYKNAGAEWLEFDPDNPALIQPANVDQYIGDCVRYRGLTRDKVSVLSHLAYTAPAEQVTHE